MTTVRLPFVTRLFHGPAVALAIALASSAATAQSLRGPEPEDSYLAQLGALIAGQQYQQAYQLSLEQLAQREGDIHYDFYHGLAALESGRENEAVFALERAANSEEPSDLRERARLELARAHYMTSNLAAAETLLNQMLSEEPSPQAREQINRILDIIRVRRANRNARAHAEVHSRLVADGNLNRPVVDSLLDAQLPGQTELYLDQAKTSGSFAELGLLAGYQHPVRRNWLLEAGTGFSKREAFTASRFNLDHLQGELAFSSRATRSTQSLRFRHSIQLNKSWLGAESFQERASLSSSVQRAAGQGWYQSFNAALSAVRYQEDDRNVNQSIISGGLIQVNEIFSQNINLYFATERAPGGTNSLHERNFYGLEFVRLWNLSQQDTPFLRIALQEVSHKTPHPVFNSTRSDTLISATFGWNRELNEQFSVNAEAVLADNSSNIELHDYSRFRAQAGVSYQF